MPRGGSAYAWWNLSGEQKESIDKARDAGMFGGTPGFPKYFWILEGTHNPEGAAKSGGGKRPTFWLNNALNDIEETIASDIASEL